MVLDELASRHRAEFAGKKRHYASARMEVDGRGVLLLKPLTYMNRSGLAIKDLLYEKDIPPERLIVVQDDMDMDPARIKIRKGGSSGGHRGIESIIMETGMVDFIRLKIGIGRNPVIPPERYVLMRFDKEELPRFERAISAAADAVRVIITEGLQKAMNAYNNKIIE